MEEAPVVCRGIEGDISGRRPASRGLVRVERLEAALDRLRAAGAVGLSRVQLQATLGVSMRSLERVLVLLRAQGAVIRVVRGGPGRAGRVVLEQGPRWEHPGGEGVVRALRLGMALLKQSPGLEGLVSDLEPLDRWLTLRLDREAAGRLDRLTEGLGGIPAPRSGSHGGILPVLQSLSDQPRRILVEPLPGSGMARRWVPHALVGQGGALRLVAWACDLGQAVVLNLSQLGPNLRQEGRWHPRRDELEALQGLTSELLSGALAPGA